MAQPRGSGPGTTPQPPPNLHPAPPPRRQTASQPRRALRACALRPAPCPAPSRKATPPGARRAPWRPAVCPAACPSTDQRCLVPRAEEGRQGATGRGSQPPRSPFLPRPSRGAALVPKGRAGAVGRACLERARGPWVGTVTHLTSLTHSLRTRSPAPSPCTFPSLFGGSDGNGGARGSAGHNRDEQVQRAEGRAARRRCPAQWRLWAPLRPGKRRSGSHCAGQNEAGEWTGGLRSPCGRGSRREGRGEGSDPEGSQQPWELSASKQRTLGPACLQPPAPP